MVRIDQGPSGKGPRFPWDPRPERGPVDINDPLGNKRPERGKVNPLDPFGRNRPERGPVDINDPLGNKRPERGKVNPLDPFGYRRERIVIDPTKLPKKLS